MPKKKVILRAKSQQENPNQSQENTEDLIDRHSYLRKIIMIDPENPQKFICNLCTENQNPNKNGFKEEIGGKLTWVKKHLQTVMHSNFTPKQDKGILEEAIKSLGRKCQEQEACSKEDQGQGEGLERQFNKDLPLSKSKEAELYLELPQFLINKHLPFSSATDLLDFIKHIISHYDLNLIERCHITNTTVGKIVKECIGSVLQERIFEELKKSPFSILIDETSDIFGGKYIGIVARFIDPNSSSLVTKLLSVIEAGSTTSGENLCEKIEREILQKMKY